MPFAELLDDAGIQRRILLLGNKSNRQGKSENRNKES
jgi:hypothetical protein